MAVTKKPMPKEKGVSIINKNLPSFGSDKQLEASIGKQVRMARKNAGVTLQQLSKQSLLSASMLSKIENGQISACLLYTSPSPRDGLLSRMPSSA